MNKGVNSLAPRAVISLCSTAGLTQRQAMISSRLIVTASAQRPMKTEHSSFSAPVASNCA